jgi:hypothetical protein
MQKNRVHQIFYSLILIHPCCQFWCYRDKQNVKTFHFLRQVTSDINDIPCVRYVRYLKKNALKVRKAWFTRVKNRKIQSLDFYDVLVFFLQATVDEKAKWMDNNLLTFCSLKTNNIVLRLFLKLSSRHVKMFWVWIILSSV